MELRWLQGGRRWQASSVLIGLCGATAYLFQILVSFSIPAWLRWILSAVGSVLLAASVALPILQANKKDRERKAALQLANEAIATYDRHMHKILIPMAGLLAEIVSSPTPKAKGLQQEQMKQAVVHFALDNITGTEPRASFFECDNQSKPTKMTCSTLWKGRARAPRREFSEGNDAGEEALRVLESKNAKFVADASNDPPPGWTSDRDYLTYIQAPVYNGDRSFGLLCVDAPKPGDLEERDIRLVELLASLLGCGLALTK